MAPISFTVGSPFATQQHRVSMFPSFPQRCRDAVSHQSLNFFPRKSGHTYVRITQLKQSNAIECIQILRKWGLMQSNVDECNWKSANALERGRVQSNIAGECNRMGRMQSIATKFQSIEVDWSRMQSITFLRVYRMRPLGWIVRNLESAEPSTEPRFVWARAFAGRRIGWTP